MNFADLSSMAPERLQRLGPVYSDLAFALGLAITRDDGSRVPIPPVLTPVVVPAQELARHSRVAGKLATAAAKVARAILRSPRRGLLLDGFSPLERRLVEATFADVDRVASVRVDFFGPPQGPLKALEVNATIPALPGYSDIGAQAFIRAVGHERGLSQRKIATLQAKNGGNTTALLGALRAGYQARWGGRPTPTIGLCARAGDPQLTELEYLAQSMTSLGCPAFVGTPDGLTLEGDEMRLSGRRIDILYRHIFVRRLEEDSVLARILAEPLRFPVFNPADPQIEAKATLAELSAAAHDPELARAYALDRDELDLARDAVAWTRRLVAGPSTDATGAAIADLLELVAAHPQRFVIKRSWEYGGRGVFIGAHLGDPSTQERVAASFGEAVEWPELVRRASEDARGGGFVVQEFIESPKQRLYYCDAVGTVHEAEAFVDFSAFSSIGLDVPGWGGTCRAGFASPIVNVAGGGGLVPVLREDVARALLE